jgi:radical SAM protein with 4Fe4S-binding SPASM domain
MDLCKCQSFWSQSEIFTDSMGLMISAQKETEAEEASLASETSLPQNIKTLYKKFIDDGKSGYFPTAHGNPSIWMQSALFEQPFMTFHKRGRLSPHLPRTMRFLNHCIPGVRRTFVSVSGDYYTCERVPTCKAQRIGNIRTGVDQEKVMNLVRRWVKACEEQCRYCWCLPTCGVGCLATLGNEDGFSVEAKNKACIFHRRNMHRVIEDYCRILEENPKAFDYANDIEFF